MDNERKLVPLSGIKEEHFQWVWRDRIPLGALTVLEGDPGQSKSTLLYDLVARVTSGKPMPFCKGKPKPAGVVLIQGEDRLDATVKPTLKALGADLDRVLVYERKRFLEQPWSLPKDVSLIEEAAQQVDAKVIVIDPLSEFLTCNPNSDASVRKALTPLVALAQSANLAVVVARHMTKHESGNHLYRGQGSIGIIGLARSALWVTDDPDSDDPYGHLLVQQKTNLSTAASLRYRTVKHAKHIGVEWLGESACTATELARWGQDDRSCLQEAKQFLLEILSNGPVQTDDVRSLALKADVRPRTLRRAREALGVKRKMAGNGYTTRYYYSLPEGENSPKPGNKSSGGNTLPVKKSE